MMMKFKKHLTEKDKAKELIEKFGHQFMDVNKINDPKHIIDYNKSLIKAVKYALICCDEIIEQWKYIHTYLGDGRGELNPNLRYWMGVKKQIKTIYRNEKKN